MSHQHFSAPTSSAITHSTNYQGDSDPDMDEALRRVRQGQQLAGAR
jgi:hypothetical protein